MRVSPFLAAVCLCWCAAPPRGAELAFHVAAETKLTKTFESELEVSLESISSSHDGEEIPADEMGEFELEITAKTKLVFVDHYRRVGPGRPEVLARTFEELGSHERQHSAFEGESDDEERDEESALEDKTVVFTWSEENARYEAKFEGDAGDEALLEPLLEDTDLRAFLPGHEVAEGDSWNIEAGAFDAIFNPGGDVGLVSEEDSEDSRERAEQLRKNFEGEVRATFKGFRDEGGAQLAVIALACDLKTHSETESSEDDVTSTERFEISFDLEGELLWDAAAGHARSYSLSGSTKLTRKADTSGEFDGESFTFSTTMVLAGTSSESGSWVAAE